MQGEKSETRESGTSMKKRFRDVGGYGGLGDRRYERYCGAFDWVVHCVGAGYFLEAIAVLDSIIWDRLSSRLGYLSGQQVDDRDSLGKVCGQLVGGSGESGFESDTSFRRIELKIKEWVSKRNHAVHATAKVFRGETSETDFRMILQSHKKTAEEGILYLQAFDLLDTESRQKAGKIPGSCPNAFFPERRPGESFLSAWRIESL
jgi:hypothetical protein